MHTCLVWSKLETQFNAPAGRALWRSFYEFLDSVEGPEGKGEGTVGTTSTDQRLRTFVDDLLGVAENREAAALLGEELENTPSTLEAVEAWQGEGKGRALFKQLFAQPIVRFAAAFYLGQIAFVLGRLQAAKEFALDAFREIPQDTTDSLPLRILEMLNVTLLLDINFHADGAIALEKWPVERIFTSISKTKLDYLEQSSSVLNLEILRDLEPGERRRRKKSATSTLRHNPKDSKRMRRFIEAFWAPVPLPKDLERKFDNRAETLRQLSPLSLAFELSRKNLAGIMLHRDRQWKQAEGTFRVVLEAIDDYRRNGQAGRDKAGLLASLEREAQVYVARLDAQRCQFDGAENMLLQAQEDYRHSGDLYAENKIKKYLGELKFRQLDWVKAERLFEEVLTRSLAEGFEHDAAIARLFLGKMYSRFSFQERARNLIHAANAHFRTSSARREMIECIFAEMATETRALDLEGHPQAHVDNAYAQMQVYETLFKWARRIPKTSETPPTWETARKEFRSAIAKERHEDLVRTMLELRLGRMPDKKLRSHFERLGEADPKAESGWESRAHIVLCRQILRVISIQEVDRKAAQRWRRDLLASSDVNAPLRKHQIRAELISALDTIVFSQMLQPEEICAHLQQTHKQREQLHLKGGFVPSLVDLSQYFVDRKTFVALLLLLMESLDLGIKGAGRGAFKNLALDALKQVYRDIIKYLIVERNLYLSVPDFASPKAQAPALWRQLQHRAPWEERYAAALDGDHGLSYPGSALRLGWVEEIAVGTATLCLVQVEKHKGRSLEGDSFERVEVPLEVLGAGHADEPLAPVLLTCRVGELDGSSHHWVAHRLPTLTADALFHSLDKEPWWYPNLPVWQNILDRLSGYERPTLASPHPNVDEVQKKYAEFARLWFSHQLPKGVFYDIFAITEETEGQSDPAPEVESSEHEPAMAIIDLLAGLGVQFESNPVREPVVQ